MASLSSLNFRLSANIAPFRKGLNKAERAMDRMGRKMQQTGKNLSIKLTAPLAALGAVSFNVFKGFEQEMSKVQAVSGATADEFKALSDNAKELGASTMFSAREVASLQTEFAKLGFSATEITKVTGATLALAQASGTDLARAAEVAGSTLRAFGLDASQTSVVTDVMAKSFSTSALDMETFAESMKYVAPVAKSAGMSIQETSAMLAIMADAGIKGSQAGTSLRRIISEIGATGKPTAEALKDLASQGLNLADAKDEVGRSAQSALLVLAGGVDRIAPLTQEYQNAGGAAQEMADIMGNTAFGASKRLESAMEGLMISIGEIVAVAIVPLIEFLASAASALNNMSDGVKTAIVVIGGIAAAIGPVVFILGSFQRALVAVRTATWLTTAATTAWGVAVQIATSPITLIILAVAALAAGIVYLGYNFQSLKAIAINSIGGLFNKVVPYINGLIEKFNAVATILGMDALLVTPFQRMEEVAVPAFKSIGQVVTEIKDDLGLFKEEAEETNEVVETTAATFEETTKQIEGTTDAVKRQSEDLTELAFKWGNLSSKIKSMSLMEPLKQDLHQVINLTDGLVRGIANNLGNAFSQAVFEGQNFFRVFTDGLKRMAAQLAATLVAAIALAVVLRAATGGIAGIGGIKDIGGTMVKYVLPAMGGIPMLADGGVVTGPTLAMIGEGGESEAVIPLSKLDGMMKNGSGSVEVFGRISGSDILLSSDRASRERTRQRGF
jgi:phage-related minor tail protein